MASSIPYLTVTELIEYPPAALDIMFFEYEQKLEDIRGNICDQLTIIKPHPLLDRITLVGLGDLYNVLVRANHLASFEDIFHPEQLKVLHHNYNALSQAIDSHHRANGSVRIDISTSNALAQIPVSLH